MGYYESIDLIRFIHSQGSGKCSVAFTARLGSFHLILDDTLGPLVTQQLGIPTLLGCCFLHVISARARSSVPVGKLGPAAVQVGEPKPDSRLQMSASSPGCAFVVLGYIMHIVEASIRICYSNLEFQFLFSLVGHFTSNDT